MRKLRIIFFILTSLIVLTSTLKAEELPVSERKKLSKLEQRLKTADPLTQINILVDMADIWAEENPDKAITYLDKATEIADKHKADNNIRAEIYDTYGAVYFYKKDYKKATYNYEKELSSAKKTSSKKKVAQALYNMAAVYQSEDKNKKALQNYLQCLEIALQIKDNNLKTASYKALYELYLQQKDYKEALNSYTNYITTVNSRMAKISSGKIRVLTKKYTGEKAARQKAEEEVISKTEQIIESDSVLKLTAYHNELLKKDSSQKADSIQLLNIKQDNAQKEILYQQQQTELKQTVIEKQNSIILLFVFLGIIALLFVLVLILMFRKIKHINKRLENQKAEIENQKDLIEEKNNQITDSINYARKIQDSILIPEPKIKRWLPQMFIYYQPKDIVSGDFYWFSKFEHKYVITAIDCTGHGVPGAFLSMIGNTLLHEIVNIKHVFKPDIILTMLHTGIMLALNQDSEDSGSEDGMDMSLCTVDTSLHRFQFAGAKNNLYVVQGDKLKILKANHYSIGGKPLRPDMKVEFTGYDFMYDDNTSIYMFSDGYLDQFGGDNDEKFNAARFRELILRNRNLPMERQKEILTQTMDDWMGKRDQIDDFLVMGVKLSQLKE